MTELNEAVRQLLDSLTAEGPELGLQVAAYLNGEPVIDCWSGVADTETGQAVDGHSMFTVFSTSKGVTATCIHILADRGKLDYDDPICKYWPEFAANGKEHATIRHALTHRVGVPQTPAGVPITDWDGMVNGIAAEAPRWEPGTKSGYHGSTYGWILGEVLRRIDGRHIRQFLQEEVCGPLGIDSMFFGVPPAEEHKVGRLIDGPPLPEDPTARQYLRNINVGPQFNSSEVRRAELPAHGGIMSAAAIARLYALLAQGGELDGVRLLSPDRIRIATEMQVDEVDVILQQAVRRALGYALGGVAGGGMEALASRPKAFGHSGLGGSLGFADPERNFAFGFTKNFMERNDPEQTKTSSIVCREVERALGLDQP
jgi:CubicO group peptidase (beta-lactamase class C family)